MSETINIQNLRFCGCKTAVICGNFIKTMDQFNVCSYFVIFLGIAVSVFAIAKRIIELNKAKYYLRKKL